MCARKRYSSFFCKRLIFIDKYLILSQFPSLLYFPANANFNLMQCLINNNNKLDKKLDKMLQLQENLQQSLNSGLAALRRCIFNMQERQFPSSFILVDDEPAIDIEPESASDAASDGLRAIRSAVSKLNDISNMIRDPQTAIENSFQRRVILMLVCEACGSPVRPGYKISRPNEQVIGRYLPLARIGIMICHNDIWLFEVN